MLEQLTRWVRRRPKVDLSHWAVTVYTRDGCCCCDRALERLKGYQRRYGFTIEEVDVDADPDLARRYGQAVPVVAVGGKVRFKGAVNPVLFERLILAEAGGVGAARSTVQSPGPEA